MRSAELFLTSRTNLRGQSNMNDTVKVYVVSNCGQWTHRIWRVLREIGCDTKIIPNTTPMDEIDADALVLSGGAPRIAWESPKLGNCTDYLNEFQGPILGIWVGFELMALHCGGKAGPAKVPEYGFAKNKTIEKEDFFTGC